MILVTAISDTLGAEDLFSPHEKKTDHEIALYSGVSYNASQGGVFSASDGAAGNVGSYASPTFGAEFWHKGDRLDLGVGIGWISTYSNEREMQGGAKSVIRFAYLPAIFEGRYYFLPAWYVGAGVGFAPIFSRVDSVIGSGTTAKFKGSAAVAVLKTGYDISLGAGLTARFMLDIVFVRDSGLDAQAASTTLGVQQDHSANSIIFLPTLAVSYLL